MKESEEQNMEANVIWEKGLTFTGSASGEFEVPLGASEDVGGDDDGFRPMQLIAIGLAGCTAMDVISVLTKKRQKVDSFKVRVTAKQESEHPRIFTQFKIEYLLTGENIDETTVQRAIELSETKYCPAQAMFHQIVPIELTYQIN